MRLFIALDFPPHVITYLEHLQQALKREIKADRWQPVHQLHLTLQFLGDVAEEMVPAITRDMDLVASIMAPFSLAPGRFGAFPGAEKPRVLWLGLDGEWRTLKQLHQLLDTRFERYEGWQRDRKPYRPHITLARGPHAGGEPLPLQAWDARFLTAPLPYWQVDAVHLYRSELRPQGAVHTILHTSRLTGTEPGPEENVTNAAVQITAGPE